MNEEVIMFCLHVVLCCVFTDILSDVKGDEQNKNFIALSEAPYCNGNKDLGSWTENSLLFFNCAKWKEQNVSFLFQFLFYLDSSCWGAAIHLTVLNTAQQTQDHNKSASRLWQETNEQWSSSSALPPPPTRGWRLNGAERERESPASPQLSSFSCSAACNNSEGALHNNRKPTR